MNAKYALAKISNKDRTLYGFLKKNYFTITTEASNLCDNWDKGTYSTILSTVASNTNNNTYMILANSVSKLVEKIKKEGLTKEFKKSLKELTKESRNGFLEQTIN